jgi:hypothetical protein
MAARRGNLMGDGFDVVVSAGTLSSSDTDAVRFPHRWTPEGVTVDADFTGAHLLHLAAAGCVLNELAHLLDVVDEVAEIPRAIRSGAPVQRVS